MSNRKSDQLGNEIAQEGCDRCFCGCKYWEYDRCVDCGTHIETVLQSPDNPNQERRHPVSTHGPFDTGYIGAHRWHVECPQGAFVWTCVCGDTGRVAGNLAFCQEAFGRHAVEKLEQAAVDLLEPSLLHRSYATLQARIGVLREQGQNDQANLLQLIVNRRYHEEG